MEDMKRVPFATSLSWMYSLTTEVGRKEILERTLVSAQKHEQLLQVPFLSKEIALSEEFLEDPRMFTSPIAAFA